MRRRIVNKKVKEECWIDREKSEIYIGDFVLTVKESDNE